MWYYLPTMINVEIEKNPNENTSSVMRRFTKRMQSSGVLQRVRGLRYFDRAKSKATMKKGALRSIKRREEYTEQYKLGTLKKKKKGRRR